MKQTCISPASAAQRAFIRGPYCAPKLPGNFTVYIQTQSAEQFLSNATREQSRGKRTLRT